jgi:hypothetical protein
MCKNKKLSNSGNLWQHISHIVHVTATNSRLTLALDTLDSMQCDHASELAVEIQAKERLRDTLTRYLDIVKVAEIFARCCLSWLRKVGFQRSHRSQISECPFFAVIFCSWIMQE